MPPPPTPTRRARRAALILALAACAVAVVVAVAGPSSGGTDAMGGASGDGGAGSSSIDAAGMDREAGMSEQDRPRAGRPAASAPEEDEATTERWPEVEWRDSVAVGLPTGGALVRGVRIPTEGRHFFTWDPVRETKPNRPWRRFGTDHAVRTTLRVLAEHRRAFPRAPRLGVGDLSRPRGGDFGTDYGPIGHVSHQNGLDVDVYYPLEDGAERAPLSVEEIDLGLSQDLVDRFVAAGAEKVFVGPSTGLTGPPDVVQAIPNHDNHIHARFPAEG
jgi:hypothetical protein